MPDVPSLAGQCIAHYRVIERLGGGAMGVVYRAHDAQLDRDIALKVLRPGLLADKPARKRFRSEALALAKLNHPCIETIHDFGSEAGVDFLVMELVPGIPLSQKLQEGALDEKQTRRLGAQLAEGLAAAHAHGVIHRDLKPSNLQITPEGRIGVGLKDQANFTEAQQAYEQAIAIRRETGDRIGEAVGLNNIAVLFYEQGKLSAAKKQYEQSLAITREIGEKRGIARALTNLGILLHEQGQLEESRKLQEQSLAIRRKIGDKARIALGLNNLATLLFDQGDLAGAQKAVDGQLPVFQQAGIQRGLAYALFIQGKLQEQQGNLAAARKTQEEVLAMRDKMGGGYQTRLWSLRVGGTFGHGTNRKDAGQERRSKGAFCGA